MPRESDSSWPKEQCTVYGAGFVAELINFQELTVHRNRQTDQAHLSGKGHAEQMARWGAFLRGAADTSLTVRAVAPKHAAHVRRARVDSAGAHRGA